MASPIELTTANSITRSGIRNALGLQPFYPTLLINADESVEAYMLDAIPNNWKPFGASAGLRIGGGVTSIGSSAFEYCPSFIGSLVIPDSVTSIGDYSFRNCTGFNGSLTIGDSVTTIGSNAFTYCSGFTGLTIGNSVTDIGSYAFYNCSGSTGLTIGNSVSSIGDYSFRNCTGFTDSLVIPSSVTYMGVDAFNGCTGLTNVDCYVTRDIMNAPYCLTATSITTLHARASDSTWTAGADTIGGQSLTVIKDL